MAEEHFKDHWEVDEQTKPLTEVQFIQLVEKLRVG